MMRFSEYDQHVNYYLIIITCQVRFVSHSTMFHGNGCILPRELRRISNRIHVYGLLRPMAQGNYSSKVCRAELWPVHSKQTLPLLHLFCFLPGLIWCRSTEGPQSLETTSDGMNVCQTHELDLTILVILWTFAPSTLGAIGHRSRIGTSVDDQHLFIILFCAIFFNTCEG